MRFHPYAFKGRLILFSGLLVRIIRNIRRIQELDMEIARPIEDVNRLSAELEQLQGRFVSVGKDLTKAKEIGEKEKKGLGRVGALKKEVDKRNKKIEKSVKNFYNTTKKEIGGFKSIMVDDETLLFKGILYLEHLFSMIERSRKITNEHKKRLLEELRKEVKSLEAKASFMELEAKYLEKGGISTVAMSEMSGFNSILLGSMVRRRAIEVNALRARIKSLERTGNIDGIFSYFEKEIMDIFEIGKKTGVLMRRATLNFRRIRSRLKIKKLLRYIDAAESIFKAVLYKVKRISNQLDIEIRQRGIKLDSMIEEEKIKLEAESSKNWKGLMQLRKDMAEFKAAQNEFKKQK